MRIPCIDEYVGTDTGVRRDTGKRIQGIFEKPDVDVLKGEYLLPIYIDELLQKGEVTVKSP